MNNKERLENVKNNIEILTLEERIWLIEQAEQLQYFAQKNGELNVFLQKHNEQKHLGKNVVDVAMNVITEQAERVQELESDDFIKVSLKSVDEVFKLRKQNKRYREALELIAAEYNFYDTNREKIMMNIAREALECEE